MGTYFCLFLVELRGLWAHLTSISHLTSKPTHNASRHPARWRQWEDAWYCAQEAWPRCRLQAYAGGGYVVACRRFRLRVDPPAKKIRPKSPYKTKPQRHPPAISAQTQSYYVWLSCFPRLRLGRLFNLDRPVEKWRRSHHPPPTTNIVDFPYWTPIYCAFPRPSQPTPRRTLIDCHVFEASNWAER